MPRYAAIIEYHGARYAGWQRQSHTLAVQSVVEQVFSKIADAPIETFCAGRTDAGVHATHQIVHFDSPVTRPDRAWLLGGNSQLPADIAVRWAGRVSEEFHARFSARARTYRYVIRNSPGRSAIAAAGVTCIADPLDLALMQQAAQYFLGEQDFSSVRAAGCGSLTAWRNIHHLQLHRCGDYIVLEITANAFLHHMVRNIVAVLCAVGRGEQTVQWVGELLHARDRQLAPGTAAPDGLHLVAVKYPARFQIPVLSPGPLWLPDRLSQ
ncbi:tRNA pseudouridine(38-40) synthase TruA [Permianibacter aggregans]|uniref:tRNA pseudouridine synthase A n=1 Tax=Permianibacter aggregans TaxID=1510150 RepID=A0A4R6UV88_9GAMM|nr:tRNA pseudouridine(38-40) synthase TruA [Permianibacter aggregans]QGX41505.1 tRNA pseudouridine(38-40) synthase TruA [Permianibacter aggregans]TDQ51298.1 tRNA pseudouridine38-40 synthase [Permianibacter aggregans]